jgi:hypothetical protein
MYSWRQIQVQGHGLRIFSVKIPRPEYFLFRFLDLITYQEVPKSFPQQILRSLVDKTTGQQPKLQQFETDRRQGLVTKFSLKIHQPHNS